MVDHEDYLRAAADAVMEQLTADPIGPGVPVDPDVAEFMGAFEEDAIVEADCADDAQLTFSEHGEVRCERQ